MQLQEPSLSSSKITALTGINTPSLSRKGIASDDYKNHYTQPLSLFFLNEDAYSHA